MVDHQSRRLQTGTHVGEEELHRLMLDYGFAERSALLGIANRIFESSLPFPDRTRRHINPSDLQRAHHLLKALAFSIADEIAGRNWKLLQQHLTRIESFIA